MSFMNKLYKIEPPNFENIGKLNEKFAEACAKPPQMRITLVSGVLDEKWTERYLCRRGGGSLEVSANFGRLVLGCMKKKKKKNSFGLQKERKPRCLRETKSSPNLFWQVLASTAKATKVHLYCE